MKKILSILLALGLVLGMVVSAMPAMAQPPAGDWTVVTVAVTASPCEFALGTYTIGITTTETLDPSHEIWVEFPEGTGFPTVWRAGHITFGGFPVNPLEITTEGNVVKFVVPQLVLADAQSIVFTPVLATGIRNPAAGAYHLFVKTSRAAMSTWVQSGWNGFFYATYAITPTVSSYYWELDFNEAYPGIAVDFIPPFKACGQDPDAPYNLASDNPYVSYDGDGGTFVTPFDLSLEAWPVGCQPCPAMTAYLQMTSRPAGGVATLYTTIAPPAAVNVHAFTSTNPLAAAAYYDLVTPAVVLDPVPAPATWAFDLGFHFSTVGIYTFDLVLEYSGTTPCEVGCETVIRELEFDVKQKKDAISIPLYEKWNLISLPLVPFDSSIDAMLATLPARAPTAPQLVSIWNYDAFGGEWFVYGAGQDSLTDIEDGKSYWFRNTYPNAGARVYDWWVFGTEKPQPPEAPSEYPVAEGWNMVGFTSLLDYASSTYLWNWMTAPLPVVYGWTQGAWTAQGWDLIDLAGSEDLEVGQGYWMAFPEGGRIFVP